MDVWEESERLKAEIGGDFSAWADLVTEDATRREASNRMPPHITFGARPNGWEDAGRWVRVLDELSYNYPIESAGWEIVLCFVGSHYAAPAWNRAIGDLRNRLLELGVVDPTLSELATRRFIFNRDAHSQVVADGDPELIAEFERLRAASLPPAPEAGIVDVVENVLEGTVSGVLGSFIYAAIADLKSRKKSRESIELDPDKARSFAETYLTDTWSITKEVLLVRQERSKGWAKSDRRTWIEVDKWSHIFVGPDYEYNVVLSIVPGKQFPMLIEVSQVPSPRNRYRELSKKGKHTRRQIG